MKSVNVQMKMNRFPSKTPCCKKQASRLRGRLAFASVPRNELAKPLQVRRIEMWLTTHPMYIVRFQGLTTS